MVKTPTSPAVSKSKDEDWNSLSDNNSLKSTVLDNNVVTVEENDGDTFGLTFEQKNLINFHNLDRTDELVEHQ